MAMFSNAKVGDKVYAWARGWGTIVYINIGKVVKVDFDNSDDSAYYTVEGKFEEDDIEPTLFWDKPKFEIPEKPFNLKEEYKKLERKEFVPGEDNYKIAYSKAFGGFTCWKTGLDDLYQISGTYYYEEDYIEEFTELLDKNNVTFEQLEQVIKEVEDEL